MAKIKFTKGELKRQRDALSQFRHYLPTLQLKKQQLQRKISEANSIMVKLENELNAKIDSIEQWSGLLLDLDIDLKEWIVPTEIQTDSVNIAGARLPVFKNIFFKQAEYDLYSTPFWIDSGIEQLRGMVRFVAETDIIKKQIAILKKELRVTTQRVNLFEKVKIPECIENIRRIRIYLGDQQANAVGIGKVAKSKIEERDLEEILT